MASPPQGPPDGSLLLRGTGPVATVYVLARPGGGRTSAAKVYPGPLDRATLAELAAEQRILAGLRNVSSMLLIDGVDKLPDGRGAIRMELCAQSLAELVDSNGPLPATAVLSLARTIAAVLRDVHEAGVVHGGVTPSNVLLRSAGQPVLADFGLGLRQRFPRPPEAAAAYTAPEVLRGGEPGERADLYGLGATLHLCLTGRSPFSARTGEPAGEVLLRALGEPPPTVTGEDLPPHLTALVTALLAKRPGDRPADAGTVLEALDAASQRPRGSTRDAASEFDDFREDFAAPRTTTPSTQPWSPPQPATPTRPPTQAKPKPTSGPPPEPQRHPDPSAEPSRTPAPQSAQQPSTPPTKPHPGPHPDPYGGPQAGAPAGPSTGTGVGPGAGPGAGPGVGPQIARPPDERAGAQPKQRLLPPPAARMAPDLRPDTASPTGPPDDWTGAQPGAQPGQRSDPHGDPHTDPHSDLRAARTGGGGQGDQPGDRQGGTHTARLTGPLEDQGDTRTRPEDDFELDSQAYLRAEPLGFDGELEPGGDGPDVPTGRDRRQKGRGPQPTLLLAAAAVIAVIALFVVLGLGGGREPSAGQVDPSPPPTQPPTSSVSTTAPTPGTPSVRLEIDDLVDNGTSVRLTWRSSKALTYAVFVAEQGRSTASARYRGAGTSLVVSVRPELKYCFLIQGTDGTTTFESLPRAIRGATCRN